MKNQAWAVIFTSRLRPDADGYGETGDRMDHLARAQPGYIGHDSVRGDDGFGITVSYWESEEAMRGWRQNAEHLAAQQAGRERFYDWFRLDVCRVERTWELARD